MKNKPDFLLLEEEGEKTVNYFGWQFFCAVGVFALIFLWANVFCDYGREVVNKVGITKLAAVSESHHLPSPTQDSSLEKAEIKGHLTLAFVGDIMLDRGVKYSVYKNFGGDYAELFAKVKSQLQGYDLLFGNLEGPVSSAGQDGGSLYSFRFEPKVLPVLKDTGFDIFSVANNHIFNWGQTAFTDTLQSLTANGLAYVGGGFDGSEAYAEKIITVDGVKIALLAFSEFPAGGVTSISTKPGIALIKEDEVKKSVSQARSQANLVIVSYHFGDEYQSEPNNFQEKYAEVAVGAGADLVVGQHPHVVENPGRYKNAWIAYSLGNFIFDQAFSPETMQGGLLEVTVNPNTKLIEKVNLKKVTLNKKFQIESIE